MPTQKRPTQVSGNILYLDDSGLKRPLDMPAQVRRGLLGLMAIACLLGGVVLFKYFDAVIGEPKRQQEAMEENIAREVSYDFPKMGELMPLDDAAISGKLSNAGHTLYEKTPAGSDNGFEVVKLPADVSLEEAALVYLNGLSNASAGDAARLMNGSWTLSTDRSSGVSMRVRYADFTSGTADLAIQNAKASQGLSDIQATDAGLDDAGNTYQEGTVEIGEATYTWRVSVIALSEVYDVAGLPDDALFVGIRFTK